MHCQCCLMSAQSSLADMQSTFFKFHNQYIDYVTIYEKCKQINLTPGAAYKICPHCMVQLRGEYSLILTSTNGVESDKLNFQNPDSSTADNELIEATDETTPTTAALSYRVLYTEPEIAAEPVPQMNDDVGEETISAVSQLLMGWNLQKLIGRFEEKQIDLFCLKHIDESDVKELVEDLRTRIYFKKHLKDWKRINAPEDETPNKLSTTINLQTILNSKSFSANTFLDYRKKMVGCKSNENTPKMLDSVARKYLIDAIVEVFLNQIMPIRTEDFQRVTNQIVSAYPEEEACSYFVSCSRSASTGGKLYDRYYCLKRKRDKRERGCKRKRDESVKSATVEQTTIAATPAEIETAKLAKQWLTSNDPAWEILESKWRESVKDRIEEIKRLKNVKESVLQWPKYTGAFGHLLINIDFDYLYPGHSDSLLKNWSAFIEICEEVLPAKTKHADTLLLCKQLQVCPTEIARHLHVICLLHAVIKPTVHWEYTNEHGAKVFHRAGINDSRDSMLMLVKSRADVESTIVKYRETLRKINLRIQPFVVAVGPSLTSIESFLTVVDGVLIFELDNLAQALDTCFKSVFVFSLEFQEASCRVWRFFQEHFFFSVAKKKDNAQMIMLSKSLKTKA